ncbi:chaplin [Streptomyces sp. NPDC003362]
MRRATRNGVFAVAAASGAMALTLPAHADSDADGGAAGSPGVISGNTIQLPVHVPVNACGNTVNVVGLLNPAVGNGCANKGGGTSEEASSVSGGGAHAEGAATDSPGVISGNGVQLPVDLPVNVSGNSVNVVGVGNPVIGNESVNSPGEEPEAPGKPKPPVTPEEPTEPRPEPESPPTGETTPVPRPAPHAPEQPTTPALAVTGSDAVLPAAVGATALVLGGAALYRRARPGNAR